MDHSTRTARWTGAAYLALALFGLLGFLLIRPRLHVAGDPAATLANLVGQSALAHAAIACELLVVLSQAAAALGFFALFRRDRAVAAFGVAAFGLANASAILASAAMLVAASGLAASASTPTDAATAASVGLLFAVADAFWAVGSVFFGLWLVPMGSFVLSTGRMPRFLGWVLVAGGVGYLLDAFLSAAVPVLPSWVGDVLVIPATVGELWMIGYLLVRGIRPRSGGPDHMPVMRVQAALPSARREAS